MMKNRNQGAKYVAGKLLLWVQVQFRNLTISLVLPRGFCDLSASSDSTSWNIALHNELLISATPVSTLWTPSSLSSPSPEPPPRLGMTLVCVFLRSPGIVLESFCPVIGNLLQ